MALKRLMVNRDLRHMLEPVSMKLTHLSRLPRCDPRHYLAQQWRWM